MDIEKERLYKSFISTHFGTGHPDGADEFPIYHKYFRRNYLMHLPVQKDAKILDLGCGMGHFLYFLEEEGYHNYLGIDLSPENIQFCRENSYTVRMSDLFSFLEETTELFDAIVMNDVLEHFEKQEVIQFLDLAYQKLTPNGKLILKVPNAANPLLASNSRYIDFTHELLFTEVSLSQVLKNASFNRVNIYPSDLYVFYYNPLNYIAKCFASMIHILLRALFLLYGHKTTKVFTKHIIAVASKAPVQKPLTSI